MPKLPLPRLSIEIQHLRVVPVLVLGLAAGLSTQLACGHRQAKTAKPPSARSSGNEADAEHRLDRRALVREQQLRQQIEGYAREVALARQLAQKHPLQIKVIDRGEVRAYVQETLHRELTPEQIATMGRIDVSLGVVDAGIDPIQALMALLEDGILGIYDPPTKTMLIADHVEGPMLPMVFRHEAAHGIQDMHFDLEALSRLRLGHSDADAARSWVVEGDAQAVALGLEVSDHSLKSLRQAALHQLVDMALEAREQPPEMRIMARSLQLPYTAGLATIVALVQEEGWGAIDALYADLPTTTEQMLHLDKLRTRERPIAIAFDRSVVAQRFPEHQVVWEDELGEASWLSMFCELGDIAGARRAAAGWDGDRYVALAAEAEPLAPPTVVGVSHWDSSGDAQEFAAMLRAYFAARVQGGQVELDGQSVFYATASLPGGGSLAALHAEIAEVGPGRQEVLQRG